MEPKKFVPVIVNPQPCSLGEAEKHLRAFAESFIGKNYTNRWVHLLIDKPEKAEKALCKFEHQLDERYCKGVGYGAITFPASLAEVYGSTPGVYFDGSELPCQISVAEAATLASSRVVDAIFSLNPGKRAIFFHHDSGVWICEK